MSAPTCLTSVALGVMLGLATPSAAGAATPQPTYATPDAAIAALQQAEQKGDPMSLTAVLGPHGERLAHSGDAVADAMDRKRFLEAYDKAHILVPDGAARMILQIGENAWPLPIPLVQAGGRWHFDADAGAQEIVDRRIGRNELQAIRTLLTGVQAQKDYFDRVMRGTGTGAYAQKLISTPGLEDGLYWNVVPGEGPSPFGPLIDEAADEGYPGGTTPKGAPEPYRGYIFRILEGQGPDAPGGAKVYVRDAAMTDGFAFIAYPAQYGSSGLMTFLVDQDGVVFQKDLGQATTKLASAMTLFDPDVSWARVDVTE
jgi:hypothetical protein